MIVVDHRTEIFLFLESVPVLSEYEQFLAYNESNSAIKKVVVRFRDLIAHYLDQLCFTASVISHDSS